METWASQTKVQQMAKQRKDHNQLKSVIKIKIKLSNHAPSCKRERKDHNQIQEISDEDKDQVFKSCSIKSIL